jgi:hypothetical protein
MALLRPGTTGTVIEAWNATPGMRDAAGSDFAG